MLEEFRTKMCDEAAIRKYGADAFLNFPGKQRTIFKGDYQCAIMN
jgi:hypothetical protein